MPTAAIIALVITVIMLFVGGWWWFRSSPPTIRPTISLPTTSSSYINDPAITAFTSKYSTASGAAITSGTPVDTLTTLIQNPAWVSALDGQACIQAFVNITGDTSGSITMVYGTAGQNIGGTVTWRSSGSSIILDGPIPTTLQALSTSGGLVMRMTQEKIQTKTVIQPGMDMYLPVAHSLAAL